MKTDIRKRDTELFQSPIDEIRASEIYKIIKTISKLDNSNCKFLRLKDFVFPEHQKCTIDMLSELFFLNIKETDKKFEKFGIENKLVLGISKDDLLITSLSERENILIYRNIPSLHSPFYEKFTIKHVANIIYNPKYQKLHLLDGQRFDNRYTQLGYTFYLIDKDLLFSILLLSRILDIPLNTTKKFDILFNSFCSDISKDESIYRDLLSVFDYIATQFKQ